MSDRRLKRGGPENGCLDCSRKWVSVLQCGAKDSAGMKPENGGS